MRSPRSERKPLPPGFGAIWVTIALDLVGFGIVIPVLPLYTRRFHASAGVIGLLVASFSVAQLLLAPVWGRVSDRIGRKPVLIASLVGTAVGSLLTGLATGIALLFVGRLIDGASGASVSVAHASVADIAEPDERARLFGLLGAAFGVGFIVGPALGGLLSLADARLPFFVAAAIAGLNAIAAIRRLPETRPLAARSARTPATGAPAAGASEGGDARPGRGSRGPSPAVAGLVVVAFLSLSAFSAFEATFALFGNRRLGLGLSSTDAVFAAIGVLIALDQVVLVRRAVRRLGERGALALGLGLNALGLALLAAAHSWLGLVPCLVLLTAGQGLVTPTLSSAVAGLARAEDRGRLLGVQQSAGGLGRVVGPALAGVAFGRIGVWAPFAGAAGVAFVALAVVAGLAVTANSATAGDVAAPSRRAEVTFE